MTKSTSQNGGMRSEKIDGTKKTDKIQKNSSCTLFMFSFLEPLLPLLFSLSFLGLIYPLIIVIKEKAETDSSWVQEFTAEEG